MTRAWTRPRRRGSRAKVSTGEETRLALDGYHDVMTYILQVARDQGARVDERLVKSLHFTMLRHRLDRRPGRWRAGRSTSSGS
jgi:hypothetical protein